MSHRNARGRPVPNHLWKAAHRLQKLVGVEYVREHWRVKVLDWCHQRSAGPGGDVTSGDDVRAVRCPNQYVPLPPELDETEKHAVLGAVHDLVFQSQLGPSGQGHPDAMAIPYIALKLTLEELSQEDSIRLLDFIAELERTWRCEHSSDFACVIWHGTEYHFSRNQAACVKILWENWEKGAPDVFGGTLVKLAGIDPTGQRPLGEVFRDTGGKVHPAWKTMVVPGVHKGSYQLAPHPKLARDHGGASRRGGRSGKSRGKTRGSSRTKGGKPSGKMMDVE